MPKASLYALGVPQRSWLNSCLILLIVGFFAAPNLIGGVVVLGFGIAYFVHPYPVQCTGNGCAGMAPYYGLLFSVIGAGMTLFGSAIVAGAVLLGRFLSRRSQAAQALSPTSGFPSPALARPASAPNPAPDLPSASLWPPNAPSS